MPLWMWSQMKQLMSTNPQMKQLMSCSHIKVKIDTFKDFKKDAYSYYMIVVNEIAMLLDLATEA